MAGMHQAIVAAALPCDTLLAALAARRGALDPEGPVEHAQAADLVSPRGHLRLVAGELHGRSYVVDGPLLWGVSSFDALAAVACRTGSLVVACGAETVQGVHAFFAARGAQVLRLYRHDRSMLARPFDWGEPLPTEAACGLAEGGGAGLLAGLAHFGFDLGAWQREGASATWLRRPAPADTGPAILHGPVAHAMEQHRRTHALPPHGRRWPRPPGPAQRSPAASGPTRPMS